MKGKIFSFLAVCYVAFALVLSTGDIKATVFEQSPVGQGWVPPDDGVEDGDCPDGCDCSEDEFTKYFDSNCLVYWTAKWCPACEKMAPMLEKLRAQGYSIYVIDYDSNKDYANKIGIRTIPTTVIRSDKKEVRRHIGVVSQATILKTLKKNTKYELF
jgi:thioredoxin 1